MELLGEEFEMRHSLIKLVFFVVVIAIADLPVRARAPISPVGSSSAAAQEKNPNSGAVSAESGSREIENSVVRVFATIRAPDLTKPWTKQPGREVTGSGVVIEGRRILTNAHVVLYAAQVQIQGSQSGDKISATVESIAPGIDLALLKLNDESFFNSHGPLPRADVLPKIKDPVLVYGFPTGGNNLSITKGIVSRIDFAPYNYSVTGLRVQIDAAINPGNSGGPAIVDDKMAGIAFSVLTNTQNIGYIIPCEEIELFLKDVADGRYDGKPAIYDGFQTLENPALRAFLKLDKSIEGIVVHDPFRTDSNYPLKRWDVVTKIGDVRVDDQGNIMIGDNQKIGFVYFVQKIAKDGKVPLTLMRGGREMAIQLPVLQSRPMLIPYLQGSYPPYFICGPVVFSVAAEELLSSISSTTGGAALTNALSLSGSPLYGRRGDRPAFEGEELVIIPSPLFAHSLAKNYASPILRVVKTINGIPVKNLRHVVEVIRNSNDEFITIDFAGLGGEALVFQRTELIAATEEILNDNGIRAQGSSDVLAVWDGKTH
jgi:S1-C subfamily serine protease